MSGAADAARAYDRDESRPDGATARLLQIWVDGGFELIVSAQLLAELKRAGADGNKRTVKLGFPYHANHIAPATVEVTATAPGSKLDQLLISNPAIPTLAVGVVQEPWRGTKEVVTRK